MKNLSKQQNLAIKKISESKLQEKIYKKIAKYIKKEDIYAIEIYFDPPSMDILGSDIHVSIRLIYLPSRFKRRYNKYLRLRINSIFSLYGASKYTQLVDKITSQFESIK